MGAGHGHGAPAPRAGARHRGRLWAAFALLGVVTLVELAAGLVTGSLALLSDAAHLLTDVLGIGMALAAIAVADRPGGGQRTFGLYRIEVLAALANAVLLGGVAAYVLVEAVRRLADPSPVLAGPMFAVALAGLTANVVAFVLLRDGARESLNVRGAYLEVLGDLVASVGVLGAAAVIWLAGWAYADPLVAVAVALFIAPRTWALARAAVRVLVQAAPSHVDVAAVRRTLAAVPGVADVHDLHVWTLTSGMDVASAHLTIARPADLGPVLATARQALRNRYGIAHATLQVEPVAAVTDCHEATW
ncbi:MAG TPA: cation diffusion facilitator family transporter [Micromonosporaceae bacterium]|nr:cation diffusion facilitator family transporter [Micromonosporaceae bacterium]